MSWGVEDKKKSSENIAIIKVKLYIDAKVVKEMRIATWMFPERGSEQERGGVDISCFKAKHMAFSENKVVPKPIVYHIVCLYCIYIYIFICINGNTGPSGPPCHYFFGFGNGNSVSPSEKGMLVVI